MDYPGAWRMLTPPEAASLPEAGLGGPLAVILAGAIAIIAVPVVGLVLMFAVGGLGGAAFILGGTFGGSTPTSTVMRLSLIPQGFLLVWAIGFLAVTLTRSASGPRIASILFAAWAAASAVNQIAIRLAIGSGRFTWPELATFLPYIALDIALAAAFWGYMHDGRRPNLYFRRRIRLT